MTEREREVEKALVKIIKRAGGEAYKWVSPGRSGVPDRIVILPGGVVWFIEVKAYGGELRPLQKVQHKRLRALGCEVITCIGAEGVARLAFRIQEAMR